MKRSILIIDTPIGIINIMLMKVCFYSSVSIGKSVPKLNDIRIPNVTDN